MRWYTAERLSPRQALTHDGYLIVTDTVIARCGDQIYHGSEVPLDPDDTGYVTVSRDASEVFRPESIASFEGKAITDDHPFSEVTPANYRTLAIGHVHNVRRGHGEDHDCLVADLVFTDPDAITKVRSKRKLALSCGYDAFYERITRGRGAQRTIIGNHVALVDEGRCGARCSIGDSGAVMYSYVADKEWLEAEHPRGQPKNPGQFAEAQASGREDEAARREAEADVLEGRKSKGAAFVSPSLAEHLDFPQAIAGLKSNRQRILEKAAKEIDEGLKLRSHNIPAVGAWSDGAENSIMSEIDGGTFAEISVAAAMKAHLAEQKDALVFQDDPDGKAFLYSFHADGDLEEIHDNLLADGIEFHTVIPTKDGATVYVADTSGDAQYAVAKGAQRYHSKVTVDQGQAKFIGPENPGGTDAEYRARSRAAYERIIGSSGVRGADALWQRIYHTYGATLHGVADMALTRVADTANIDYAWSEDIDWRDWEEGKHPRGQPENKGEFASSPGGGGGKSKTYVRAAEAGEKQPSSGPQHGKTYVRAGETGEVTKSEQERTGRMTAAAAGLAGKALGAAKGAFGAEDYEIAHQHFKNAKAHPRDIARVGRYLRAMAKAGPHLLKAHIMEEKHHAVHAIGGLKSLLTGKRPTPQQSKGLLSFGTRALMVTAGMALGDPTGTIGHLAATFGEDVVHHVLIEHAVKLFVGGSAGMVSGAMASPQQDAAPDVPDNDQDPNAEGDGEGTELGDEDIALLQRFLECLADAVENMTEQDAQTVLAQGEMDDDEESSEGDDEDDEHQDIDYPTHDDIEWSEAKHPREPEGAAASKGGEWTKGAGASAARMAEIRGKKTEAKGGKEERAAAVAERQAKRATEKAAAKEAAGKAKTEANRVQKIPRSKDEPFGISTRMPSEPQQKKTSLNAHETAQHLVDYQSTYEPEVQEWLEKASDLLVGNELYNRGLEKKVEGQERKRKEQQPYVGMPKGPEGETPREAAERFIEYAKRNILSLHDAVDESWRERASHWYDGACKIAGEWGKRYGKTPQQIAGVIAAQSPKKDWFQNVEVAKRIIEYNSDKMKDTVFTKAAADRLDEFVANRKKEADRLNYARMRAKFFTADGKGVRLGDLTDPLERAAFISMYDQGNAADKDLVPDGLHYRELSPEGKYGDFVRNKDVDPEDAEDADEGAKTKAKKAKPGKMGDPTVLVWPVMENIAKGLKILDNGSAENISKNLGEAHKVRNFYMNIMYPQSKGGHVTIDTHAIAGAFMRPLGQNDPEVLVGLGNSSPSNNTHGMGGTYPLIAEAYRRAAAERKILPRQMQSITWEGLRGLFSPEAKRDKGLRGKVDNEWRKHMNGEQTEDQARAAIMKLANPETSKPRTPKWYARTM